MRETASLYDEYVAANYDNDLFGIFAEARRVALAQLPQLPPAPAILDIGCGTGLWLETLARARPGGRLIGLDPSARMLEAVVRRCAAKTILGDALVAREQGAPASLDLVSMHFVLAYVDNDAAIAQAAALLKPGGMLSIVSSTFESLQTTQRLAEPFLPRDAQRQGVIVPSTTDELVARIEAHGFTVTEKAPIDRDISFDSFDQFYDFSVHAGWLVQYVDVLSPLRAISASLAQFFPFHDRIRAISVAARRA